MGFARLEAAYLNMHRKPGVEPFRPADFLPKYGLPEQQAATPVDNSEQLRQVLMQPRG